MHDTIRRAVLALRHWYADYERAYERQQLLNRPWEEDFLHFAPDGKIHGQLAPPDDHRRHSVTADGWCPCWARQGHLQRPVR